MGKRFIKQKNGSWFDGDGNAGDGREYKRPTADIEESACFFTGSGGVNAFFW